MASENSLHYEKNTSNASVNFSIAANALPLNTRYSAFSGNRMCNLLKAGISLSHLKLHHSKYAFGNCTLQGCIWYYVDLQGGLVIRVKVSQNALQVSHTYIVFIRKTEFLNQKILRVLLQKDAPDCKMNQLSQILAL
jgi:hypothetical protein